VDWWPDGQDRFQLEFLWDTYKTKKKGEALPGE
jgi:hypothetical protein